MPETPPESPWDPNVTPFGGFWGTNGELFSEKQVKMEVKTDKYRKVRILENIEKPPLVFQRFSLIFQYLGAKK